MFGWAERTGYVPEGRNPSKRIERYPSRGRSRFLTQPEFSRLAETLVVAETKGLPYLIDQSRPTAKHAPKPENRRVMIGADTTGAIKLLMLTGCRLREILTLRWADVHVEEALLTIRDSKTGPKTVPLSTSAIQVIQSIPRIGEYVFPGRDVTHPRSGLKRPWRAVTAHAGLSDLRIHDLRHSFASIGVEVGLSLPVIGKLLGHSQPASTARYAHLDRHPLQQASEAIGMHINAITKS
jgi:integrase